MKAQKKLQTGLKLIKNIKVNGETLSLKLDSDKLQVIHKLGALLALDYFDIEYVTSLCHAVDLTAKVRRAEQSGMVHIAAHAGPW